jgi:hypothetical protein
MAVFTITISDQTLLDGITAARGVRNEEIITMTPEGETPVTLATDNDYVQFVMEKAAQSYANTLLGN